MTSCPLTSLFWRELRRKYLNELFETQDFRLATQKGQRSTCHRLHMAALTPIRSTESALSSRSQETENQVFLLESMGPAKKNFVILSLVIANNKYVKLCFTSIGLKVHRTNNLTFVILSCGYHWFQICQNSWSTCFNGNTFMAETWWFMYRSLLIFTQINLFECKKFMQMMSSFCHVFISNILLNLKIFSHDQHLAESFHLKF